MEVFKSVKQNMKVLSSMVPVNRNHADVNHQMFLFCGINFQSGMPLAVQCQTFFVWINLAENVHKCIELWKMYLNIHHILDLESFLVAQVMVWFLLVSFMNLHQNKSGSWIVYCRRKTAFDLLMLKLSTKKLHQCSVVYMEMKISINLNWTQSCVC